MGLSGGSAGGCGIVGLASGYEENQEEIKENSVLGAILGGPGGSWVDLGGSWAGLEAILEGSWSCLGGSWGDLGGSWRDLGGLEGVWERFGRARE